MRTALATFAICSLAILAGCGGPSEVPLGPEHAATAGLAMTSSTQGTLEFYGFNPYRDADTGSVADGALAVSSSHQVSPFESLVDIPAPQAAAAECHTVIGDDTDADGDGIIDDIRVEHDCSATDGTVTVTLTGALYLQDTDPQPNPFNFAAGQEDFTLAATAPNYSASITENWAVESSQSGALFALDTSASVSAQEQRPQQSAEFSVSQDLGASLDVISGDVTIDGTWNVRIADAQQAAVANATIATVPSVHYNPACAHRVDAGAIEATYDGPDGEAVLRAEFTCDTVTYYFNGTQVDEGPNS